MSVLSFPRIYFKGFTSWDPCTFNNNDFKDFPTYDAANAALNWEFLAKQDPPITQQNFTETFRPWAIKAQSNGADTVVPAEWNMFGSHAVEWVQYPANNKTTTITGGDLAYNSPADPNDPLIATPVAISGDKPYSAAKLVDINPASFWSSQIYFAGMKFGSDACGFSGSRVKRMHSRWINLQRIYDPHSNYAQPAASVAACFQTCFPNPVHFVNTGNSGLINALQTAAGKAQGVMVRWTAYVNLYFQNGIFNDIKARPRTYEELSQALCDAFEIWKEDPSKTDQFFAQPCYSHTVGVIGVWDQDELVSVPGGRYLAAQNAVAPASGGGTAVLGPAVANVDLTTSVISIDLNSTIPEVPSATSPPTSDLQKESFGSLSLGALVNGKFKALTSIEPAAYDQAAYEASAGIVDVPFDQTTDAGKSLQDGTGLLAIHVDGLIALAEQGGGFSAQTDERGIYLDEADSTQFPVTVFKSGVLAPGAQVLVVKFDAGLGLISAEADEQLVGFTNGEQRVIQVGDVDTRVTIVTADANGVASVGISAVNPGFPVLAFYPYPAGGQLPAPPPYLLAPPHKSPPPNKDGITDAFYATVRVLPFDNDMPQRFIDYWNQTQDPEKAWEFVYNNVLYVYDMIFNYMLKQVDLGSREAVTKNAKYIKAAVMPQLVAESTGAMPVTRDMSRGARFTLLIYLYIAECDFEVGELTRDILGELGVHS